MSEYTTSMEAITWKVTVAHKDTPWNRTVIGQVRINGDGRFDAWQNGLLGDYSTMAIAKAAVVRRWRKSREGQS